MKCACLVGIAIMFTSAFALGAEPSTTAVKEKPQTQAQRATAVVAEDPESLKQRALDEGLSKDIVEKLDARQLVEVLRDKEVFRHHDDLSKDALEKLGPEQIAAVLQAREHRKMQTNWEDILVPLSFFLCAGFIVGVALYFRDRQHTQRQQTLRLMVEKGVAIPPELLSPPTLKRSDLRRGLVLLGTGVGLSGFFAVTGLGTPGLWGVGLIPALIGAGFLLVWKLEPNGKK
jgi:hypothetical protein